MQRSLDVFTRYAGEEFAAIVENDEISVAKLAETMRRRVELLAIEHSGSSYGVVTISLGAATIILDQAGELSFLIEQADIALYESKRNGRNRVEVYAR